jgi:DNA-binding transcriptional MocR family regulator
MTMWTPDLSERTGPRYLAIADALADDISKGAVTAGTRLPTHRELAYQLGVTVGTVSRAYAAAEQRGLTYGEVGRGTFVRGEAGPDGDGTGFFSSFDVDTNQIDFGPNMSPPGDRRNYLSAALAEISTQPGLDELLAYETAGGHPAHRQAMAEAAAYFGMTTTAERITICTGAQHAVTSALMAVTRPGDTLAVEAVTYPAVKGLAAHLGLKLEPLPIDTDGIMPEAFEKLCQARPPKALYCLPTLHNPTTAIMPFERRRAIAEIARRHGVAILEDDVMGYLLEDLPPPIAMIAPEITYFISGVSKCFAPGLRAGLVIAPEGKSEGVRTAVNLTSWMAPPLMLEVVRLWLGNGTGAELIAWHKREVAGRQQIFRAAFDANMIDSHPGSYHIWLKLPDPWRANEFADQAKREGVTILPAETFATGRGRIPEAVRICLGAPKNRDAVARGAEILAGLLHENERITRPVF